MFAACWEKIDGSGLGTAVVAASPAADGAETITGKKKGESHVYLYADKKGPPTITYYAGYGWERAGQITTMQSWQGYLNNFKERIDNPVTVRFDN